MRQKTNGRSRPLLILLIFLSILIASAYYRGGAGVIVGSQRIVLAVTSPVQKAATNILIPFRQVSGYTVRLSRTSADNRRLKAKNAELEKEVAQLEQYKEDVGRLRSLAGFRSESELRTIAAPVISRSPTSWQSLATIGIGSRSGVKEKQSVITEKGLVGQVVEVAGGAAIVQLVDDRRSGVSVEIARTGAIGVIKGLMDNRLRLRFVREPERIKVGDQIVTSGSGGVHPRGIPVGKVSQIKKTAYSLERQIVVKPMVDYALLTDVLVITGN